MLSYAKSGTARTGGRLNGLKKKVKLNSLTLGEFFQKKWSIPLTNLVERQICNLTVLGNSRD